jgi:hypothetical protein
MHISELVEVARFLKTFVEGKNLLRQYDQLVNAVQSASQNQRPENVQKFLKGLIAIHEDASRQVYSPAQQRVIDDYGAGELLGEAAVQRLEGIFEEHSAHPQGLIAALQAMQQETQKMVERARALIDALGPLLEEEQEEEGAREGEGTLWLYFAEATNVQTIEELGESAETWHQVLHHFSRLPGAVSEGGRLVYVRKYSPLELEVAAEYALLIPLGFAVKFVLDRVEQIIAIRIKAEELKQLKLKNSVVNPLLKEAEERRKAIAEEGAKEVTEKYGGDGEVTNAVKLAIASILAFLENGGVLDIQVANQDPEPTQDGNDTEPNSRRQLREVIVALRREMKRLPPPLDGPND